MTPSPYSPPSPRPSLSPSHFGSVGGGGWGVPDPQWGGERRFGRGGGSSTATTRSWGRRSPTRYSRRSIYRSWSSWSTDRPLSTASWRRYSGRSIHGSALGKTAGSSWARYQVGAKQKCGRPEILKLSILSLWVLKQFGEKMPDKQLFIHPWLDWISSSSMSTLAAGGFSGAEGIFKVLPLHPLQKVEIHGLEQVAKTGGNV